MTAGISLIAALAQNRTIGLNGRMPWHISADLKNFKFVTFGAPVIMGRKTYASIGSALPGRANIVITRNSKLSLPDADVFTDLNSGIEKALSLAKKDGKEEVFVIGGAEVYCQSLDLASKMYLTEVEADYSGDTFFPEFDMHLWQEKSRRSHPSELPGQPAFSFVVYTRL